MKHKTSKMFKAIVILGLLSLVGCAHHRDVRPGVDGLHRVVIQTEGGEHDKQDAISQAEHFCKEQGKYAAIVEEKQSYTGSMDEQTYKNAKTASKVVTAVGGAAYVFGGKNEKTAGGIGSIGGGIADSALGKAYVVEMKFKCM